MQQLVQQAHEGGSYPAPDVFRTKIQQAIRQKFIRHATTLQILIQRQTVPRRYDLDADDGECR